MEKSRFVYVMYVSTSPEKLWNALIDPEMTAQYWQHENASDWRPGSRWEHRRCDQAKTVDLIGKVVESSPPRRLEITWAFPGDEGRKERHSKVTFEIEPYRDTARLTLTHDDLQPGSEMFDGITDGWPKVLSSLKTLLEIGRPLPRLW